MLASICFITAHLNTASHFADYVKVYEQAGIPCKVISGQEVAGKFSKLTSEVTVIDPSGVETDALIPSCSIVITDVGNERWGELFRKLSGVKKIAYYDNPEVYVPGGYSEVAAKVISSAEVVLFANKDLVVKGIQKEEGVSLDLSNKALLGVGYYPKEEGDKILALKQDVEKSEGVKKGLFDRQGTIDTGQRVIAYIGGANEAYYEKAFPHFIDLLSQVDPSSVENTIFILQQHPRAKKEGNPDVKVLENLPPHVKFIVSDIPTTDALAISDGALYYQTSMGAQFVFGGIPLVAQVGHEVYSDMLIRAGFPSITTKEALEEVLTQNGEGGNLHLLEKELGTDPNWKENLLKVVEL